MLSQFRKIPNSKEYYKLSAHNGRNYYFIEREKALKVLEIYRKDNSSSTEWTFYFVKGGVEKLIDTIIREKPKLYRNRYPESNEDELSIIETMKKFALEDLRVPKRG